MISWRWMPNMSHFIYLSRRFLLRWISWPFFLDKYHLTLFYFLFGWLSFGPKRRFESSCHFVNFSMYTLSAKLADSWMFFFDTNPFSSVSSVFVRFFRSSGAFLWHHSTFFLSNLEFIEICHILLWFFGNIFETFSPCLWI